MRLQGKETGTNGKGTPNGRRNQSASVRRGKQGKPTGQKKSQEIVMIFVNLKYIFCNFVH